MLQCLFHEAVMGVVRTGYIDDVHCIIREHVINAVVDLAHAVPGCKVHRLLMGAVAYCIQVLAHLLQGLCHLIGNYPRAQHRPVQIFLCHKKPPDKT